jgi:glucose-6-phosphate isomerase
LESARITSERSSSKIALLSFLASFGCSVYSQRFKFKPMANSKMQSWERFQKYYAEFPSIGLAVDLSRTNVDDKFFAAMGPRIQKAFAEMDALETGSIANPDENRMVGHYWLRNPSLAPKPAIGREIVNTIERISEFSAKIHSGEVRGAGGPFRNFLLIGIGGSVLGPQFVANALGEPQTDKLKPFFFDNTDPDGMARVLAVIGKDLSKTLCIVVSKSGSTKETRNGMLVAEAAFAQSGLHFGHHAVAVTSEGSQLDEHALQNKWLERFPMWDWIGGRTSELSAVGLLPAALQGFNINDLIRGACECDKKTRSHIVKENPAALLSLAIYALGNGKGDKNMVVLPYKDRLEFISKYLQQLIMESIGKELDRNQNVVNQGITVLGNKGATDQHSYVQQLRDGLSNFFVLFIEILKDGQGPFIEVEPSVTSGDYLLGFLLGTRQALAEKKRESITITVNEVSPFSIGMLIALFERVVGFYASMIDVNAYHQPGVEAGKRAAAQVIEIQKDILKFFSDHLRKKFSIDEIAKGIGKPDDKEVVFEVCEHLSANSVRKVLKSLGDTPFSSRYGLI